jgi:hypothetical protein
MRSRQRIKQSVLVPEESGSRRQTSEDDDFFGVEKSMPFRMGKWRLLPPEVEEQPN